MGHLDGDDLRIRARVPAEAAEDEGNKVGEHEGVDGDDREVDLVEERDGRLLGLETAGKDLRRNGGLDDKNVIADGTGNHEVETDIRGGKVWGE